MKKLFTFALAMVGSVSAIYAQEVKSTEVKNITPINSWIKIGVNAGLPVGKISNEQSFNVGLDLRGQLMQTGHFGFGLASGYNHYFAKKNFSAIDIIPAAAMFRYYPKTEGLFLGTDAGYNFVTNAGKKGGFYVNPQIGYHNRDWNIFAYYNHTFNSQLPLRNAGVGLSYNLRFSK